MVSPRLLLEFARGQVLVRRALLEVENEEQRVDGELAEQRLLLEDRRRMGREVRRRAVRVARHVLLRAVSVQGGGQIGKRSGQQRQLVLELVRGSA